MTGTVLLNDGDLPAASYDRGFIQFYPVAVPSEGYFIHVGSTASPAPYATTMLPGRYFARFGPSYLACRGDMPGTVPCVSQVLVGCNAPATAP